MTYLDRLANLIYVATDHDVRPMDEEDRSLYLAYALLCRAKGEAVTSEDVHDAWSLWATLHAPAHPYLVPFDELTPDVQAYDRRYRDTIRFVAERKAALV